MVTTPMTLTLEEKKLVSFLIVSSRSRSAISSCFRENSNLQTEKKLPINNKNIAHQPQNHCTSTTKPLHINPQNHQTSNTKPLHINSQNHRTSNTKTFAYQPQIKPSYINNKTITHRPLKPLNIKYKSWCISTTKKHGTSTTKPLHINPQIH